MERDKTKCNGKYKTVDSNDLKEMKDDMKGTKEKMDSDMKVLTMDTSHMTREKFETALAMKTNVKNVMLGRFKISIYFY